MAFEHLVEAREHEDTEQQQRAPERDLSKARARADPRPQSREQPRESSAAASRASAVPSPKAAITRNTMPRSRPRAASATAAPSVGPTHGSHTRPSRAPTPNWPRPVACVAAGPSSKRAVKRERPSTTRSPRGRISRTAAAATMSSAEIWRKSAGSIPVLTSSAPSSVPASANERLRPAARNQAPRRPAVAAEDITTGTSGHTQGESTPSAPAAAASGTEATSSVTGKRRPGRGRPRSSRGRSRRHCARAPARPGTGSECSGPALGARRARPSACRSPRAG